MYLFSEGNRLDEQGNFVLFSEGEQYEMVDSRVEEEIDAEGEEGNAAGDGTGEGNTAIEIQDTVRKTKPNSTKPNNDGGEGNTAIDKNLNADSDATEEPLVDNIKEVMLAIKSSMPNDK